MEDWFKNIDPESIADPETRAAVQTLWTAGELPVIASTAQRLMKGDDLLGRCALFDVYSHACTTDGTWRLEAFSGLWPQLVTMARDILDHIWSGKPLKQPALRDCMVASGMHMIWRTVEMEDAPRVLHSLRSELHWRIIWPSVSAASFMRGEDPTFDRETAPLLAAVAQREDLSAPIRRVAIQALGASTSPEDLELLKEFLQRLPVPEAAVCASILLDAGGAYTQVVQEVARRWPPCDEYPVPQVLERIESMS